ncbi:TPA: hypothetical protein K8979_004315 [Escherichia coli]|uniref:RipA family octameric membrane protein n=1 Tax=Enterobacteriaceae TaxID=543 RepID=UPI00069C8503|nr:MULTISPECIES: hypothetical protein [Enterobacteriaceae]EKK2834750.1 hypothetical protein [Escherichia coli O33]EEV6014769.1 hypothetical protein [Escherichia coli]EEW1585134.1 hypothetical protein [Escherichia coli]EFA9604790.1 hypothetical protein [Escherichia coli]EFD9699899.1 hypothetical protein [Escherichia coli]
MDNTKKEPFVIKDEDKEFFQEFLGVSTIIMEDSLDHKKLIAALDKAHDIRKFEIDLYWKRATYFFAFFTVITAAYGYLFTHTEYITYTPFISIIGTVFSICFYYVNIGSKYWQENWELVIDKLEYYVTGNLYKVLFYKTINDLRPSVSNINTFLSAFMIMLWLACFITSLILISSHYPLIVLLSTVIYSLSVPITVFSCRKTVSQEFISMGKKHHIFKFREPTYESHKS